MPGDTYPKFTVAAVQAASVWLDRDATIDKVEALTSQAARNGAALVVFSESYIPAFPVWNLTHRPLDQPAFFRRLYDHALLIPSAQFRKLAAIAQSSGVYLSVGITEKTDLLTVLAAAAERTTHLKLGTAIIPVYSRHPVLLALQALSLSNLAPQRLRLGLGIGAPELAKRMYGVDMESPLSYVREYVQVLRPLLQQGKVHHQGHFFAADIALPAATQIPSSLLPSDLRLSAWPVK